MQQSVETEDDDTVGRVEMTRALEELGRELTARRSTAQEVTAASWKSLADAWNVRLGKKEGSQLLSKTRKSKQQKGPEDWSVETLEASLSWLKYTRSQT